MALLDINNFLINFTTPQPAPKPGQAMVQKSSDNVKEAIAQNPVMMAYQRMSMEAGLRRPQGITFATLRRMSRVNWVDRACIKTLTDEITGQPWNIVPVDAKKPYNTNLQKFLELLLTQPNQNKESWRMLMDKVVEDILVCDAGIIEKVRDEKGRVRELYYVDGTTIKPCYDIKGMLGSPTAYEQYLPTPTNQLAVASWTKWDLIRMQWNPSGAIDNYGWGLSPVEAGLAVATAFLNAEAYTMSFFQRNTIPPVIINLGEDVPENEVANFRAYLAAEMAGQAGFWQPFAMSGGKGFDIKQLMKSPAEMAFKEYLEWQMKWKVALYRMSPQDIGFNLDQYKVEGNVQLQLSQNKAINSIKDMLAGYINTEIINDPGWGISPVDVNLKFQWIDADTVDPVDQATIDKIYWGMGVIENNYIRKERFGLDPIVGGKVPFVIQGATAFALNPKLMDEAIGTQIAEDAGDTDDSEADEEESALADASKHLALPPVKEEVRKVFSPEEGLITDLSMTSTAIAWMDDRGVTQPLFITDFGKQYGFTVKPNFLDEKRQQEPLEAKVSEVIRQLKANTPEVKIMSFDEVAQLIPLHLHANLTKWINVEAPYDSMEWRQRWGNSRMSDYFIVTGYITGKDLNNKELQASMKTQPDIFKNAIQDFARIWLIEKRFYLGDRKPGHYIITQQGNGFGVDYQFFNTKHSWEKTSKFLPESLKELNPALYQYFTQCLVKEYQLLDSLEKSFKMRPRNWDKQEQVLDLEKQIGNKIQRKMLNWYRHAVHVKSVDKSEAFQNIDDLEDVQKLKKKIDLKVTKSSSFDPDEDYITDGQYVWQGSTRYPIAVLDDYVGSWFDVKDPDQHLQDFITDMTKAGMSLAAMAYASLLLLTTSDYLSFARMGQQDALSRITTGMNGAKVTPSTQDTAVFEARTTFLASQMSQSMSSAIDKIMQNGVASGATYGVMRDQILQAFGINPNDPTQVGWRADRIARTEAMLAVREGALQEYAAQGISYVNLVIMETACEECIDLANGNPYTIQEANDIGDGGLHPNCMCLWQPDDEEFAQQNV